MVQTHERYKENNIIGNTDLAIVVTSYEGHKPFLKYALSRYRETGKYVICAYDTHNDTVPVDIHAIPNAWVHKHKTYGAEKRNGWLWNIIYAASVIWMFPNIKYIVTTNSDCVWENPTNTDGLVDLMGNNHIMSASSEENGMIHTCNVLWKRTCFLAFVDHIKNKLSVNTPQSHSPEVLLRDFISNSSFNNKTLPVHPRYPEKHFYGGKIDHYSAYNQPCTWKDVIGYRNLGGEHKAACQEHLEPVDKKFFDLRGHGEYLNKHEQDTLYMYFQTGDRRWLYKYWAEGEDSYWNRRYYSIDYYGNERLTDDSKRKEFGPPSERLGHFSRFLYNSYILKDDLYYSKWKEVIGE